MTRKFFPCFAAACCLAFVCVLWVAPAYPQAQPQPAALGQVAQSSEGYIGDAVVTQGSTVYSGDYLSTPNSGALLVRVGGLSLELEASSGAHIYRAPYGAIVELDRGTVIFRTPGTQENFVIVASDVRITPALSTSDFGRVTIDDPCNITVYSQRGQVNVQAGSDSHAVEPGKAYRVRALNEVTYRKFLSPGADDYHRFHEHTPCAPLEMVRSRGPLAAGHSRFTEIAIATTIVLTTIPVIKAFESPDRP